MACTTLILDGGLSTELEKMGFHIQGDPLWSSRILHTNPNAIKDVHYSFLQCGSDIITTATYQASIEGFTKHLGLKPEEAEDLMMSGVRLAKESTAEFISSGLKADRKVPVVAGSVGPFGAFLLDGSEYTGVYANSMSVEELKNWHRPQIRCLVAAGVDILALETIPSLKEAEALVELLKEFPEAKAWLSFSCKVTTSGNLIVVWFVYSSVSHICSVLLQYVTCSLNTLGHLTITPMFGSSPAVAKKCHSNKGFPKTLQHNSCKTRLMITCESPDFQWITEKRIPFTELSVEWKEQGASWIGGCCRISPADIAQLKSL
ncbi:homocysteine S-methyltransferase-like isoform 2, partial [Silurus meridionalis]